MTPPRLASRILVGALLRLTEQQGGFGAVLAKGDPESGAVTLVLLEKGVNPSILERVLQANGRYQWQSVGGEALANPEELKRFLQRRRDFDPDSWILELDIPSRERFAAEMTASN